MREEELKRDWRRLREVVKARWPKLTADDLAAIDGDPAWLVDALIARYGIERAAAEREWRAFAAHLGNGKTGPFETLRVDARDALEPGAAKVRAGIAELADGLRALAREAGTLGSERVHELAGTARDTARENFAELGDRVEGSFERIGTFVRERPYTALGLAFLAGWLVFGRR